MGDTIIVLHAYSLGGGTYTGFFDLAERDLLQAFAVLIGLILEKEHIIQAFKHAEVLEASEHLRRALLRSVSHQLKTRYRPSKPVSMF